MEVREAGSADHLSREVVKGCQHTDVGLLPSGWRVSRLSELASIRTGIAKNSGAAIDNPMVVHYLRVANVQDGYLDLSEMSQLKIRADDVKRYAVLAGDMLMNEGGDLDKLGRGALWKGEFDPCVHQNHVFVVRCGSRLLPEFLSAWTGSASARRFFMLAGRQTTNLASINKTSLGQLPVPLPPTKDEQKAIAEALSDADALIESLSLLLAKKRQVKQGAMQELLTGRRRLPGFSGEWVEKLLGELFQFSGGLSASRDQLSTNGHLYLHYGDIHTSAKNFIDVTAEGSSVPRLDVPLGKVSSTALLSHGDLVFVDASEDDDGVSKHVVVLNPDGVPFIAGLHTIVAKQRCGELNSLFLRYCFQTQAAREQFKFYAVGTKVSGISKTNIAKIALPIPTHEEQFAIAEILVSIDEDIAALEAKLSKAHQLKQGMMQELLTGRIRLVQPTSNVIPLRVKPAAVNPPSPHLAHNWQINEAVVIGVLAQRFGSEKFPLPRKRRVKLMYLLHRHAEGRAEGYLKKAAGPYNPNTKYKGPEAIALKNGYVHALRNDKYEGFVAGDKIEQAQRYFDQWYGTAALDWLERFHYRKTDDLELLATVDMAMVDLAAAGQLADLAGVKRAIAAHPEWVPKLSRELFSEQNIQRAIAECATLFTA